MQNDDTKLNLKQALLEILQVVNKNHLGKDEQAADSLKLDGQEATYYATAYNLNTHASNTNNPHQITKEQIHLGEVINKPMDDIPAPTSDNYVKSSGVYTAIKVIKDKIPNQASSTNQLADKDFVNSSISTATATFRGTYTNKDSFPNNVDANDYVFYDTTDELGNRKFDKYKYDGISWIYEYTLNNSSFTSDQWKAINSGITKEKLSNILNNLDTKVDKVEGKGLSANDFTTDLLNKLNSIEEGAQQNTITGIKGDAETKYRTGEVSISKENIGLGNVDNTSDKDKPISTAQQNAINKPLYNLGAFDTISGNVITRQTGYVDLSTLDWFIGGSEESWTGLIFATNFYQAKFINTYQTNAKVSSRYNVVGRNSINIDLSLCIDWDGYGAQIQIKDNSFAKTDEGIAQFKASLQGIILQYELVDNLHYTEEIIEGQPLITLDQQGSQWLRSEWEKGLNLFDFTTANPNYYKSGVFRGDVNVNNNGTIIVGVDASGDYGRGFKIQVKANTTYTFSFTKNITNTLYVEAFQNNTSIQLNTFGTSGRVSFTFTTNNSSDFIVIGFSTTGSAVGNLTISDLMLNYGNHPYPYQPYNSKAHITNYEADFLKEESLKSANLLQKTNDQSYDLNFLEDNTAYTLSFSLSADIGVTLVDGTSKVVDRGLSSGYYSFTFIKNSGGNASLWFSDVSKVSNIMLNEGSEPLPYQEYNGSIVREKQLNEINQKIDGIIGGGEANLQNYYTKAEMDSALDLKANKKDVSEVDIDLEGTGTIVSIPENTTGYGTIEKLGGKSYKSENLCNGSVITDTQIQSNTMGYATLEKGKTYTFRIISNENAGATTFNINNERIVDYIAVGSGYTFTAEKDYDNALITCYFNTANTQAKAMLNEGSEALPYEPYFEGIKIEYPTNVKSVGRNLWDEEWEVGKLNDTTGIKEVGYSNTIRSKNFIKCSPNTSYKNYAKNLTDIVMYIFFYDINENFISKENKYCNFDTTPFVTPNNCCYLMFYLQSIYGTTYNYDICINKSNEAINGKYYPYTEHNLPQTNVINYVSTQLQTKHSWTQDNASKWLGLGVGNDSNIINYANKKGDVKYSIIDLGSLSYSKVSAFISEKYYFSAVLSNVKLAASPTSLANAICSNYSLKSGDELYIEAPDNSIAIPYDNNIVMIIDNNYTDADTFKTAMQGVMLIYELATPIEIDLSSLETEEHFECESNGSIIHDNIANYKYSFPVSLKGQVELNFEHDKEQQRDIDSLKNEIFELRNTIIGALEGEY